MKYGTLYAYWTHEWHGDYLFFSRKAKELGFDILEISAGDLLDMPDAQLREWRAVCRDLGIRITSNIGPAKDKDVASACPEVRRAGIAFLTAIMHKMDLLDSRSLVGVLYTYWPNTFSDLDKPAIWSRGVAGVREMSKTAEDLGINLCLEVVNRYETHILNTAEEAVRFCREVNSKNVRILLDTFHMNIEEDSILDAFRTAGGLLGHVHVGESNRRLPGQGGLPWGEIGGVLREIHYTGDVVMEPFVTQGGTVGRDIKVWRDLSGGENMREMDEAIGRSLAFLRSAFGEE